MSEQTRKKAVEALKAAVDDRINGGRIDLADAAEKFRQAVGSEAEQRDVDAAVATVGALARRIDSLRGSAIGDRHFHISRLAALDALLERIVEGTRPRTDEELAAEAAAAQGITRARAAVEDLEAALADAQRQLEEAVRRADLDSIEKLRRAASVEIPGQLDAAHLGLLDAQINAAVLPVGPAEEALRATAAAAEKAAAKVAAAEKVLEAARSEHEMCRARAVSAKSRAQELAAAVAQLRSQRDEMATEATEDQLTRVRRYAGLEAGPAPTPPPPEPQPRQVIRPRPGQHVSFVN